MTRQKTLGEQQRWLMSHQSPTSPNLHQALLDSTSDAIIVTDLQFVVTGWNQAAVNLYKWSVDDAMGQRFGDLVPTSYLDDSFEQAVEALTECGRWQGEVIQATRTGEELTIQSAVNMVRNAEGAPIGVVAVNRDITEVKRTRRALELSRDLAQVFLTAESEATLGEMLRVLTGALRCGYGQLALYDEEDELVVRAATAAEPLPDGHARAVAIHHGGEAIGELVLADRQRPFGESAVEMLENAANQIAPLLAGMVNREYQAREQALLEAQMHQSQKMESVGRLAGGIAHDFNNLLTVILNHAEDLEAELVPGTRHHRKASQILKASHRAEALTTQLLAFSRRQVLRPVVLDLDQSITELSGMLRRLIDEDIAMVTTLGGQGAQVRADRGQLDQVLLNLVVNARDAMPRGGTLGIQTEVVHLTRVEALSKGVEPGTWAVLSVTDDGVGMDPDIAERVFEPFFTTKDWPDGTGLGLSTVYGIVLQSGGHVSVHGREEGGSRFEVMLPVVTDPDVPSEEPPLTAPEPESLVSATILVVEDEGAVLDLVRWILETQGYQVLTASDGAEALHLYRDEAERIDLVISDVVMPELSGPELVSQLRALRPSLKVLYMTGYAGDALNHRGIPELGDHLPKPFRGKQLLGKVDALLRDVETTPSSPR